MDPSHKNADDNLLTVRDLTMDYASIDGRVRVLENVSMQMQKGEIVGVVGESGSGKTTLGLAIIGLLDKPPAEIINGSVIFEGKDLLKTLELAKSVILLSVKTLLTNFRPASLTNGFALQTVI